jgi:archaellum component FlaC
MADKIPEKRRLSLEYINKIEKNPKKLKKFMKDNSDKIAEILKKCLQHQDLPEELAKEIQEVAPGEAVFLSLYPLTVNKESVPLSNITEDHEERMGIIGASEVVDPSIFKDTKISNEFSHFAAIIADRWNLKVSLNFV